MSGLAVEGVSVRRGGRALLSEVSFACREPALVGLLGPNGAGKTTLMRALAGLLAPSAGTVTLDGTDVRRLADRARARRIAYLAQDRSVSWPLRCRDVVMLGRHPHRPAMAGPSREDRETVERAMEELEVADLADRPISTLSGGEAARVLIARALAQTPDILLADEPTDALDPAHQLSVMQQFQAIARAGHLVVVTMHDLTLASRWCDRLIVLDAGKVHADGPPETTVDAALLDRVYGVEAATLSVDGKPVIVPVRLMPRAGRTSAGG